MTTPPPAGDAEATEPAHDTYRVVARWLHLDPADPDYETATVGTSGDDRWYTTRTGPGQTPVRLHDSEAAARAQASDWMTGEGWIEDLQPTEDQ